MTTQSLTNPSAVKRSIAALGPVSQLAFVPADFDASLRFWTETMGAGPFFMMSHIKADQTKYLGQAAAIDFSAAVGYWGDIMIELIQQHDATPSIYSTWREQGLDGLHHVLIAVDDMQEALEVCEQAGATVLQEALFRGGSAQVVYVDTHGGPGTMVELWKGDDAGRAFFARIRDAARDWDGKDPIRYLS